MRDPNRIDPIMKELTKLWQLHPDWRFCQLLCNVAVLTGYKKGDLFYFEDDNLLPGLKMLERSD